MKTKILIMEDAPVLHFLVEFIKEVEQKHDRSFEIVFAPSKLEAMERLPEAEMAILDVSNEGRDVAYKAFNQCRMPVIALSVRPEDAENYKCPNIRVILKPEIDWKKLEDSILSFDTKVRYDKSILRKAKLAAEFIRQQKPWLN